MHPQVVTNITINGVAVERAVTWDGQTIVSREMIPKDNWGPGPWTEEFDKVQWVDGDSGYGCLVVREPHSGHLCGYVRLQPGHPIHGLPYEDDALQDLTVHGGVTWSRASDAGDDAAELGIAWSPADPTDWFVGFDCAHGWDQKPAMDALLTLLGIREQSTRLGLLRGETYRDLGYVMGQCKHLAHQLHDLDWGEV